jgi:hypothetical protein
MSTNGNKIGPRYMPNSLKERQCDPAKRAGQVSVWCDEAIALSSKKIASL